MRDLTLDYPWIRTPLVVSAPMRLLALAPLAVSVSKAGGLGFIGAGTDVHDLRNQLQQAADLIKGSILDTSSDVLPVGVGFINWALDLDVVLEALGGFKPAAIWLFAPMEVLDLGEWCRKIREATQGKTKIWIQVGAVSDALHVFTLCRPDVLVIQGSDAGGHALCQSASIVSLLPEVADALRDEMHHDLTLIAAGGIVDGRGIAASVTLGAAGVVMGTRFLASEEVNIAKGYRDDVIRSKDGEISTVRTKIHDKLRGTPGWPSNYDGRGIINQSFIEAIQGKDMDELEQAYQEALRRGDDGWGEQGRLTAYAGTGVGLIREVLPAQTIVKDARDQANVILSKHARSKL